MVDFFFQGCEIRNGDTFVFLNGNIAGAKQAKTFAEREMHVERKGSATPLGTFVVLLEVVRPEIFFPNGRGGITRVARTGTVVFFENIVGDLSDIELFDLR